MGLFSHFCRQVTEPSGPTPGSPAAQIGGFGRHLPSGTTAPPTHPGGTIVCVGMPSESSQYSSAAQSLASAHFTPGVTHCWNEQSSALEQHAAPQTLTSSQHAPLTQVWPLA